MKKSHNPIAVGLLSVALAAVLSLGAVTPAFAGVPQTVTRKEAIQRAYTWSRVRVPYSQTRWLRGYRTDCSGFVSMAYALKDSKGNPESLTTWTLPDVSKRITKEELRPGDFMLDINEHVVLFEKWANKEHTRYVAIEQNGTTDNTVRWVVDYPFRLGGNSYKPYRYLGFKPDGPSPWQIKHRRQAAAEKYMARVEAKNAALEAKAAASKVATHSVVVKLATPTPVATRTVTPIVKHEQASILPTSLLEVIVGFLTK